MWMRKECRSDGLCGRCVSWESEQVVRWSDKEEDVGGNYGGKEEIIKR